MSVRGHSADTQAVHAARTNRSAESGISTTSTSPDPMPNDRVTHPDIAPGECRRVFTLLPVTPAQGEDPGPAEKARGSRRCGDGSR